MKLVPKAKPIRIRIKIGNEEYSTFDSLRENLSLPELYPLFLDGRFVKWLNQIGEKERAEHAEKLKAECNNKDDNTRNYILLLSLFDKEVEQTLSKYNHSIDAFLSNIHLDILFNLQSKHGVHIEWPKVIRHRLSRLNSVERLEEMKRLFKLDEASLFFDEKGWGAEMAKLVEEADDGVSTYMELFYYLIDSSYEPRRIQPVMESFHNNLKGTYPLTNILANDERTRKQLSILYALQILKGLDIKWDEVFVGCVKQARDKIEVYKIMREILGIIRNNRELWQSFINRCIEVGVKEARAFKNEWEILANSDDYEIVQTAFREFRRSGPKKFNVSILEYASLKNDLGKQIIDLITFLKELFLDENAKRPDLSDDYLKCLMSLMVMVRKYQYKEWGYGVYNPMPQKYKTFLKEMAAKDIELASKILSKESWGYNLIFMNLIEEIQSKLKEERRKK